MRRRCAGRGCVPTQPGRGSCAARCNVTRRQARPDRRLAHARRRAGAGPSRSVSSAGAPRPDQRAISGARLATRPVPTAGARALARADDLERAGAGLGRPRACSVSGRGPHAAHRSFWPAEFRAVTGLGLGGRSLRRRHPRSDRGRASARSTAGATAPRAGASSRTAGERACRLNEGLAWLQPRPRAVCARRAEAGTGRAAAARSPARQQAVSTARRDRSGLRAVAPVCGGSRRTATRRCCAWSRLPGRYDAGATFQSWIHLPLEDAARPRPSFAERKPAVSEHGRLQICRCQGTGESRGMSTRAHDRVLLERALLDLVVRAFRARRWCGGEDEQHRFERPDPGSADATSTRSEVMGAFWVQRLATSAGLIGTG